VSSFINSPNFSPTLNLQSDKTKTLSFNSEPELLKKKRYLEYLISDEYDQDENWIYTMISNYQIPLKSSK
jgi:hypothetical protein